jgi:hypothetical protein
MFGREPTHLAASVTQFSSLGFVWAGLRMNLFAGDDAFLELVAGLGYPIGVSRVFNTSFGGGRPMRIDGRPYTSGTRRLRDAPPALAGLSLRSVTDRRARARRWRRDAELEYASITAFEYLAYDLLALGAPEELFVGCLRAARDERKHARMCYSIASAYAGRALGPAPLRLPDRRLVPKLATLVRETILDGCLGEGIAAARARAHLRAEQDEAVTKVLRAIARDEARHARLAWDIVAWGAPAVGIATLEAVLRDVEGEYLEEVEARAVQRRVAQRLRLLIRDRRDEGAGIDDCDSPLLRFSKSATEQGRAA